MTSAAEGGSAAVESVDAVHDAGISSFIGEEVAESDRPELTAADVVISTAQIPGRPAPLLISREMVEAMRPGQEVVVQLVQRGERKDLRLTLGSW